MEKKSIIPANPITEPLFPIKVLFALLFTETNENINTMILVYVKRASIRTKNTH